MVRGSPRSQQLRVIGGHWRGRRLCFPAIEDLRPTPDRVRETLFNWLQFVIPGSRCLDLFAGSGALGIEALSRDAAMAVFVEQNPIAVRQLQESLNLLQAASNHVEQADVLAWLLTRSRPFDVVFLDPPFGRNLLAPACDALERGGWLAPGAHIYLETEIALSGLQLPASWEIIRDKRAGQVSYRLAVRSG